MEANSTVSLEKHINSFRIALSVPMATEKQERLFGPMFMYVRMADQKS